MLTKLINFLRKKKTKQMPYEVFNEIMNNKCICSATCNEYCKTKTK
jgi:2-hydroxy-3-keto-5-methylthiopentenyl-1-phosphate phosphatase